RKGSMRHHYPHRRRRGTRTQQPIQTPKSSIHPTQGLRFLRRNLRTGQHLSDLLHQEDHTSTHRTPISTKRHIAKVRTHPTLPIRAGHKRHRAHADTPHQAQRPTSPSAPPAPTGNGPDTKAPAPAPTPGNNPAPDHEPPQQHPPPPPAPATSPPARKEHHLPDASAQARPGHPPPPEPHPTPAPALVLVPSAQEDPAHTYAPEKHDADAPHQPTHGHNPTGRHAPHAWDATDGRVQQTWQVEFSCRPDSNRSAMAPGRICGTSPGSCVYRISVTITLP